MKTNKFFFLFLLNLSVFQFAFSQPDIVCAPASWDYGSVSIVIFSEKTFLITNTGSSDLIATSTIITGSNASDFGIQFGGGGFILAPGGTPREIVVRFSPASFGSKSATLSIANNDPDENPLNIPLSGTGLASDIDSNPASWDYGSVNVGSHSDKTITISNTGNTDLFVSNSTFTGSDASNFSSQSGGSWYSYTLTPGGTRNIVVRFSPTNFGSKSATLSIASNDPDENPLNIALTGTGIAPDIYFIYNQLTWTCSVGEWSEYGGLIYNVGNAILNVASTTITGPDALEFSIPSGGGEFSVVQGETHAIQIRFTPTNYGIKNATLTITSNDPDENPLNITLTGTGLAPDIALDPHFDQPLDFRTAIIGSHSMFYFNIINEGNTDLNVTSMTITGANASEFSIHSGGGAFILGPSAYHLFCLYFYPTSIGTRTASLDITSNDPDENPFNIALIGTGLAPDIGSNPASWNYGSVNVGNQSEKIFVISNTGNANLDVTSTTLTGSNASDFSIQSGGGAFTLAPGGTRNIAVRFGPASVGYKNASLSIASNDPDENPFQIGQTGQGIGGGGGVPDIDVSPESLNAVRTDTLDLVIRNTGGADLSFEILDGNLLQNSGFENGFEPWIEEDYVNAGTIVRDSVEWHSGDWSAKITVDHLVNYWELQLKQCGIQVDDQQAYAVSFWAKAQKARTVAVGLCKETSEWSDISERYTASLSTSWRRYFSTLHVDIPDGVPNPLPPEDTRFFFSEIGTDLTPLWIDDVKLQPADSASGWLWFESTAGTVGPGSQKTVRVFFDPDGLANGTYESVLFVRSNDLDEPSVAVSVMLTVSGSSVEDSGNRNISKAYELHPNYPNPFNPVTTVSYRLGSACEVRLAVYSVIGEEVAVLDEGRRSAGEHRVTFDGRSLQSGVYVCKLTAGSIKQMRKMVLVK